MTIYNCKSENLTELTCSNMLYILLERLVWACYAYGGMGLFPFFFFFVHGLNIERECRWIPGCGIHQKGQKPLHVHIPNLVLTI